MKKILVPCDFSDARDKAIKFVINLAEKKDEIVFINLVNDSGIPEKHAQNLKAAGLKLKNLTELCTNTTDGQITDSQDLLINY